MRQSRRSWQSRNAMRSFGAMRVCFTFRRFQNDHCPQESRKRQRVWESTKQRVFHGEKRSFFICHLTPKGEGTSSSTDEDNRHQTNDRHRTARGAAASRKRLSLGTF